MYPAVCVCVCGGGGGGGVEPPPLNIIIVSDVEYQGCSQGGGGGLGSAEPPKTKKGPPKRPLECTKWSTITVCLINSTTWRI